MKIPLFPLDVVLFPGAALPLHIFEERYKEMIGECLRSKQDFGVVQARRDGLAVVGCTASILRVTHRYPDGRMDIFCRGERRFEIECLNAQRSFFQAEVEFLSDADPQSGRADRELCAAFHMEMMELSGVDMAEFPQLDLDLPVAFLLASAIPADNDCKQGLLHLHSDAERTACLLEFYGQILPKLRRGSLTGRHSAQNGHIM
ncbi:MAG: LON peptidase substrate-binding domain-containing protein [Acidobacteriaceae bacterium]